MSFGKVVGAQDRPNVLLKLPDGSVGFFTLFYFSLLLKFSLKKLKRSL